MTEEMKNMIIAGNITENDMMKEAIRQGMMTMKQDGVMKVLKGLVALEEVCNQRYNKI